MFRRDIPGRDQVSVGRDDDSGQVWISRRQFGKAEDDFAGVDTVHIDREDLPTVIKYLQEALSHDA